MTSKAKSLRDMARAQLAADEERKRKRKAPPQRTMRGMLQMPYGQFIDEGEQLVALAMAEQAEERKRKRAAGRKTNAARKPAQAKQTKRKTKMPAPNADLARSWGDPAPTFEDASAAEAHDVMTIEQAAEHLHVTVQTVHNLRRRGLLTALRTAQAAGGRGNRAHSVYFERAEVVALAGLPKDAMTRQQVARALKKSERTVARMTSQGALVKHSHALGKGRGGARVYWRRSELPK